MERHINTYSGLNQDAGYDSISESLYVDAKDIRITTTSGESMGSWTNIKGNKESFAIPIAGSFGDPSVSWTSSVVGTLEIIGYTTIRNRIILFVADDSGQNGWIYDVQYNTATREILPGFPVLKYYNNALNFSKANPIEALGRFESESIQRVYWTDYNNYLRSLNIEDPFLNILDNGLIDIFPDVSYTQPLLQTIFTGGTLLAGLYQVAYRLRTNDGKETLISPPSNLIHLVASAETLVQSAQYVGSLTGTNTNKALNIIIDTSNYLNFATIDIFTIFHEDYNGVPTVNFIETKTIVGNTTEFIITGTEASFPIEFLEYTSKTFPFKTCKTLTQKDSSLVIANTKGGYFSAKDRITQLGETFDFDVFRYKNVATVITTNNDKFNVDYNKDAHWLADWHNNQQYKYQSDGATLGGESANINFKFHLEPMTIIGNSTDGFSNVANIPIESHDLNDTLNLEYYNTTFPSNTSPFISGLLKGYKRGESYRFGIIFYNKKGEASFVEHLADVKFPDISDQDSAVNASGTNYFPLCSDTGTSVVGYSLGIEFNIDFSTCPDFFSEIESYQIVRVQRTDNDKRRLTTGVLKTFTDVRIGTSAPNNFDFNLPQGSGAGITTLHLYADVGATSRIATRFNLLGGVITPYGDVLGDFLALHTPEFSYNFENTASLTTSTTNACVLITGAYSHTNGTIDSTVDLSGPEDLGNTMQDYRVTLKNTYRLDSITTENIKILGSGSNYIQMTDTAAYTDNVVGPITSAGSDYYLRNYYATYNITGGGTGINDPQAGAGASSIYEVSRGATGVMGRVDKLLNDPITSLPLPSPTSGFDYFDNTFVKPESPILLDSCVPIFDILLPKAEIYGGTTDFALQTNIFIPASPVIDKTLVAPKVFGGDIFLTTFSFQSSSVELNTEFYDGAGTGSPNAFATSRVRSAVLPVESSINVELAYGSTLKTGVKYTEAVSGSTFTVLRQETNNTVTTNGLSSGSTFKMYDHNTVYSRENYDVTFFTKPINVSNSSANDIRARLSNVKINEEITDSWTKFGSNNYYDVDDYGPINKILNWKDIVYFIQDKAFGIYAINRAAITSTDDGVPTQLGQGQGFGKHQYYSKEHGCIHQWGVKTSNSSIYFVDAIHRKLFNFTGEGVNPLSEIKGMHSFVQRLPSGVFLRKEDGGDNPILKKGITLGKDIINDEIYFTFLGTGNFTVLAESTSYNVGDIVYAPQSGLYYVITESYTSADNKLLIFKELLTHSRFVYDYDNFTDNSLVFDELAQSFSSTLSQTPKIWIENGDILQTSSPQTPTKIFTNNIGNWGEFYGNIQEASITLVINPNADINKVIRTLEFNSIVRNDLKVIDRAKTITAFKIKTEVQDTGKILFSAGRIKRRFDKWRIKIPRDVNSINQKGRLRSSHFIVTLYFDNNDNKEIIMNRLMSYFDYQVF
jgi:hypothetical protein